MKKKDRRIEKYWTVLRDFITSFVKDQGEKRKKKGFK